MPAAWLVSIAVPTLSPPQKQDDLCWLFPCLGLFYYISNTYWHDVTSTLFKRCTHLLCIATINFYRLFCHVRRDWGKPFARRRPRSERTLRSGRDEARLAGLIRAMPRRDNSGGACQRYSASVPGKQRCVSRCRKTSRAAHFSCASSGSDWGKKSAFQAEPLRGEMAARVVLQLSINGYELAQ